MKEEDIHTVIWRCLKTGIGNYVWAGESSKVEVASNRKRFARDERRDERVMKLFRSEGPAKLRKVASGSALQNLWLRQTKVRLQMVSIDRCRLLESGGVVRKVKRKGGRRSKTSNKLMEIRNWFRIRFRKERKAKHVSYLFLAFARQTQHAERENLFDFALRTDTIIRSIKHKKKSLVAKAREHRGTFRLSSRDAP